MKKYQIVTLTHPGIIKDNFNIQGKADLIAEALSDTMAV